MARPRTTSDEAILKATVRAIGRYGVSGLTLAAAASEAGLSPATLVQRFGSKRGLLLAVARRNEADAEELFKRARQKHDSPLAALHGTLTELAEGVRSPEELANHLGFLQLDLTDAEFRQYTAGQARRLHEGFAGLISEAVAAGELAAEADPARLARSVQITYNGTLILWAMAPEGALTDVLRADIDQLLQAYRP
ncbi:TetR/AcrR family transcriptional regulator [Streptosporangium fragile]|uniref:TetR/AcrR family transcriptional regulator n=1 Tax=Streptosporangium fragile TaxID=46186 RepID=A0ABP6IQK2_9ACTN